ncbi:hypothetical protein GCM10020229_10490 [Kitasatospora albolonga]|uniref:DEAD/DEAH box helicase family protein n=1 Tax=Kitasatospora albolonga TaxID=68173 RepID=UPI0031EE4ADB
MTKTPDPSTLATATATSPPNGERRWPRADQQAGIAAAARQLRRAGSRATVVSACGTGKTLIGIRVAEEVGAHQVLVVVPTKDLAVADGPGVAGGPASGADAAGFLDGRRREQRPEGGECRQHG